MTQHKFEKGEKYRPVVTVTKVKKNTPTVVEMSGNRISWSINTNTGRINKW